MLFFVVVAISVFTVDGAKPRLRTSQNVISNSPRKQATLVQQPAIFATEMAKGPVEIHGLAGNAGSYPDEVTDAEAQPPSAQDSTHEDKDEAAEPLRSSTSGNGPVPPTVGSTQATDFTGEKDYDNDADGGDASDYLQGTPSNQTEVLTQQDELELGITPAPPADDPNTQSIDLPFVVYPGYAKLEKQKLERAQKRKLAKQKLQQHNRTTNRTQQNQTINRTQLAQPRKVQSPQLVKSLTATGSSHSVKVTAGAPAAAIAKATPPPGYAAGWGQPVGILRPKGWENCLKFAKYTKEEGYKGVALVRVWKSTCEPGMLAGSATERYRLMCVSLGKAVEKFAVKPDWGLEEMCDSVLATFHDITAVDTPFDR